MKCIKSYLWMIQVKFYVMNFQRDKEIEMYLHEKKKNMHCKYNIQWSVYRW